MQGMQVRSLVRELRFHMPWSTAKKKRSVIQLSELKFFFIINIDLNFDATFYEYFFIKPSLSLLPGNKSQCPSGMKYSISHVSFFFFKFYLWLRLIFVAGSVVVVHGLSCSAACGIFLDQGLNLCLL